MASWLDQFNSGVDTSPFATGSLGGGFGKQPRKPRPWGAMPQFFRDRFGAFGGNSAQPSSLPDMTPMQPQQPPGGGAAMQNSGSASQQWGSIIPTDGGPAMQNAGSPASQWGGGGGQLANVMAQLQGQQPVAPPLNLNSGPVAPPLDLNAEYERIKAEQGAGAAREWMKQQQW